MSKKAETRRPKHERRPKAEIRNPKGTRILEILVAGRSKASAKGLSEHFAPVPSGFGLRPSFGLRISAFGLSP